MGKNKIGIVFQREYMVKVKKKSFIILTLLAPVLFAALMVVPSIIMLWGGDEDMQRVAVYDRSGIVCWADDSTGSNVKYVTITPQQFGCSDFNELKSRFDALGYDAIANIEVSDSASMLLSTAIYSKSQVGLELQNAFNRRVNDAVTDWRLAQYDIDGLKEIIESLESDIKADTIILDEETGDEHSSMVEVYMVLGYVCSFAIYMFILLFANGVMSSVIEEKSSRVVEVLVSSVKPFQLMMGKILGSAAVGLTQFAIWIVLTALLVTGVATIFGGSVISAKSPVAVEQMIPADAGEQSSVAVAQVDAGALVESIEQQSEEDGASAIINSVLGTLKGVHIGMLLAGFLLYFLFGYLLYAALFAAIGSAVENVADTQQLSLPVTIPLIIGLFIMLSTFQNPDSSLSFWASMIPLTSPVVMMARLPYGIPVWEFVLSLSILILTFVGITWMCARIYRVGILSYGTKATWKDLLKWLRIK